MRMRPHSGRQIALILVILGLRMVHITANPKICCTIIQNLHNRDDIISLISTSKSFKIPAEKRLYESLAFTDPRRIALACRTLTGVKSRNLALHVRSFVYSPDARRFIPSLIVRSGLEGTANASGPGGAANIVTLPESFYLALQRAFENMSNLESLFFNDVPTFRNSWVLNSDQVKFKLREARLRVIWDEQTLAFLRKQRMTLMVLQLAESGRVPRFQSDDLGDAKDNGGGAIQNDTTRLSRDHNVDFPRLQIFEGSCYHALQLMSLRSPLTHLQISLNRDEPPKAIQHLSTQLSSSDTAKCTLRTISIIDLPPSPEIISALLSTITRSCPQIRHLGLIQYPTTHRHEIILQYLYNLHQLCSLELDLAAWVPQPTLPAQRALCSEIRTFCPTIRHVSFYLSNGYRVRWSCLVYPTPPAPGNANANADTVENGGGSSAPSQTAPSRSLGGGVPPAGGGGINASRGIGVGGRCGVSQPTATVHKFGVWHSRTEQNAYPQHSSVWRMV